VGIPIAGLVSGAGVIVRIGWLTFAIGGLDFASIQHIQYMLSPDENTSHSHRTADAKHTGGDQPLDGTQANVEYFGDFFTRIYAIRLYYGAFRMVRHNRAV
jgi:hypothetical protein